jgi:hypothetical protein
LHAPPLNKWANLIINVRVIDKENKNSESDPSGPIVACHDYHGSIKMHIIIIVVDSSKPF